MSERPKTVDDIVDDIEIQENSVYSEVPELEEFDDLGDSDTMDMEEIDGPASSLDDF